MIKNFLLNIKIAFNYSYYLCYRKALKQAEYSRDVRFFPILYARQYHSFYPVINFMTISMFVFNFSSFNSELLFLLMSIVVGIADNIYLIYNHSKILKAAEESETKGDFDK